MKENIKAKVTNKDFDKLDLPEIIYKYRTWSNNDHKTILTNQIVYMASPFDFEDTKDCKSQKRYDLLTDKDIYNHYFSLSEKKYPEKTLQQHCEYAKEWFDKSLMRHPEEIKKIQEKHLKEDAKFFGVLCLTLNPISHRMWSKYSDNYKGICVGFNPKLTFKFLGCEGGKVDYCNELPIIYPNDSFEVEHCKQIFCKEIIWEFEDEYRTRVFFPKGATIQERQIKIPKECFTEIIFGYNITDESKNEIIEICNQQKLNVSFKKVISVNHVDLILSNC